MSLTSLLFLFLFLPIALVVYYISNEKSRDYILVGISLLFYSICSIRSIVLFISSTLATVTVGRILNKTENRRIQKGLFIAGIAFQTAILVFYKCIGTEALLEGSFLGKELSVGNVILPLGLSFFTFKSISYLADIYNGKIHLEKGIVSDILYLTFFGQIQAGPLTRYNEMLASRNRKFDRRQFSDGVYRFLVGMNKKILIADVLMNVTSEIFSTPFEKFTTGYAWLGSICFSLQLFFDFSGYSDMAIGISEMFGMGCRENFDYPYMTHSISKFWRRWHISLGEWFRDYIYIPLGGSKKGNRWRVAFNLFVVWIITGIWHGLTLNFIAWGIAYFVAIEFERISGFPGRIKSKIGRAIYRVITLAFINFQWVIFNSDSLTAGIRYIKRMLIVTDNPITSIRTVFLLKDYVFFLAVGILLCFPIVPYLNEKLKGKVHFFYKACEIVIVLLGSIWAVSFVVAGHNNPFTYANF